MDTPKKEGKLGDVLDKDALHAQFMASPHIDWTKFCESIGIPPGRTRSEFPVATWQDQKRKSLAIAEADKLAQMIFERRFKWHKDVLRTLNEYPESNDIVHNLLRARMNEYIAMIKSDNEKGTQLFKQVKTSELATLQQAISGVTESKYKSLLLSDWTVKLAEAEADRGTEKDVTGTGMKFTVEGKEMSLKDIEAAVSKYYEQS